MANRYWCGECGFKTPWLGRSEGLRRRVEHYARKHPGTSPGGQVETRRRGPAPVRCRLAALALALLAVVAARHR
ncbi:hypothetical protein [Streptomyces sp. A1136]|uniref:hypothetical protein n=1 Tax=Streptomyces sp. A1136 TaxID=2563102 RepID=UPI00144698B6|nr:hypothetical protein [Streptomyces sp. A1136]